MDEMVRDLLIALGIFMLGYRLGTYRQKRRTERDQT